MTKSNIFKILIVALTVCALMSIGVVPCFATDGETEDPSVADAAKTNLENRVIEMGDWIQTNPMQSVLIALLLAAVVVYFAIYFYRKSKRKN